MTNTARPALDALAEACVAAGLDPRGAEPIRIAENQIWRLSAGVIVRMAPPDRLETAAREVRVARWLADNGVRAVTPLGVDQPVESTGRVATFWEEVPAHHHGSIADVALALKELHALSPPHVRHRNARPLRPRAAEADRGASLPVEDGRWLLDLHTDLAARWATGLPTGLPRRAVHGDAWPGNIVRINGGGRLVMDLERFSVGPPEWDLASTAVRTRTTGAVTEAEYAAYCALYGHDVTDWSGYDLLARARELRMVSYAAQHAAGDPRWQAQAQHRVDCLRGRCGPRPWAWVGIL
ncbi:aminoglycoside phosphotransferase [Streptomyces sp. WM4235]|uniref:aminoglycoside phosphotransferase family protein n=1 Tax=Streptomyces sp. WM4235 TaxID=1415551 RepID=UPI0006AF9CB2|nr:aminoglycoside phosphotransferase family protein [Streptomyces sp. WM4235]KOU65956.1 aminoglycoside phosphotransferase [Streptomyces sp. WM4235]